MTTKLTKIDFFIAIVVTLIFSLRWSNALPFSNSFPALNDMDNLGVYARYALFANEPFSLPLGKISSLAYPFTNGNIARGSVPLFAIFFKTINQVFPTFFLKVPYFVTIEIFFFFISSLFCLKIFKVVLPSLNWQSKLLATLLIVLSPTILFRSSIYYNITFIVAYYPYYLSMIYFFIKYYKTPTLKYFLLLTLTASTAAAIDYYLFFTILIIIGSILFFEIFEVVFSKKNKIQLTNTILVLISTIVFSTTLLKILGNNGNIEIPKNYNVLTGRYNDPNLDGYGGGLGGGYHVADLLTPIIAPTDKGKTKNAKSILSKLNYPLTTDILQRGQLSGFAYIGSILTLFLFFFIGFFLLKIWKRRSRLKILINFYTQNKIFHSNIYIKLTLASLIIFSFSWGYLIHFGGEVFYFTFTPSSVIAAMIPKFMMARALGRMAIFMSLVISIILSLKLVVFLMEKVTKPILHFSVIFILCLIHIYDIKDYLTHNITTVGEPLTHTFNKEDRDLILDLTKNKTAIILGKKMLSELNWCRISYSLAFISKIPISGANVGFGEPDKIHHYFNNQRNAIKEGKLSKLYSENQKIVLAIPKELKDDVLNKTDTPIKLTELKSQPVILITKREIK